LFKNEYKIKIKEDGKDKYITFVLNYAQGHKKCFMDFVYDYSYGIKIQ